MAQGVPDDAARMRGEVALVRNWDSPSRDWLLRVEEKRVAELLKELCWPRMPERVLKGRGVKAEKWSAAGYQRHGRLEVGTETRFAWRRSCAMELRLEARPERRSEFGGSNLLGPS